MYNQENRKKSDSKMGLLIMMLLFVFVCPSKMVGQDIKKDSKEKSSTTISVVEKTEKDSLKDTKKEGFFKKFGQLFKFKENRNKKELERFNAYLKESAQELQKQMADSSATLILEQLKVLGQKIAQLDSIKKNTQVPVNDASEMLIPPSKLKLDSLKSEGKPDGLLKKIGQVFKFRENRNRTEKERIQIFMEELLREDAKTKDARLSIIPETINKIAEELRKIKDSITNFHRKPKEKAVDTPMITESIKGELMAVLEENIDYNKKVKKELAMKIDSFLNKSRGINSYSSTYLNTEEPEDCIIEGDSLARYFRRCLRPKIAIMGWHDVAENGDFENYQWDYLSSINLIGYELASDGRTKSPESMDKILSSGIIKKAQIYGSDVFLTIHNENESELRSFLRDTDSTAQKKFFNELALLLMDDKFQGINLQFESISTSDKDYLTAFVTRLYQELKNSGPNIKIMLTLPAIKNSKSQDDVLAYDFSVLNPIMDYYMVLTDNMINHDNKVAQSLSPLYKSNEDASGTIVSTIDFYSKKNIPDDKFIMTVTWSGVEWEVQNFLYGALKMNKKEKPMSYGEIIENYKYKPDNGRIILEGYDPEQVTAYLNVLEQDVESETLEFNKRQIWYEDIISLYEKYNWAVKNGLGGVAVRGLENDDGDFKYEGLWNVLGAALIKVDSCDTRTEIIDQKLSGLDYWKAFKSDFYWAILNELGDDAEPGEKEWEYHDWEEKVHDIESNTGIYKLKKGYFVGFNSVYFLEKRIKKYDREIYDNELDNDEQCLYLFLRWRIYARVFAIGFLFLAFSTAVLFYINRWYLRYPPKKKSAVKLVQALRILCSLGAISCLLLYMYFDPWFDIGGSANQWIAWDTLSMLLVIGFVIGYIITPILRRKNLVPKGMP